MAFPIVSVLISAGVSFALGQLRPKVKVPKPQDLEGWKAEEGRVLDYIAGIAAVEGNCTWWDDVRISGEDIRPAYNANLVMRLCQGPIDQILDLQAGGKSIRFQVPGKKQSSHLATYVIDPALPYPAPGEDWTGDFVDFDINARQMFGGELREGGLEKRVRVYRGSLDQSAIDELTTHSWELKGLDGGSAYPGACYAAFGRSSIEEAEFYWGTIAQPKPIVWILTRYPRALLDLGLDPEYTNHIIGFDCNPAEQIYELSLDPRLGLGLTPDAIDLPSLARGGALFEREQFGQSIHLRQKEKGKGILDELLKALDCTYTPHPTTGLLTLTPLRNDYALGSLLTVTDDPGVANAWDLEEVTPLAPDSHNQVQLSYRRFAGGVMGSVTELLSAGLSFGLFGIWYYQTNGKNISNVVVRVGSTTLTPVVDFTVHSASGLIVIGRNATTEPLIGEPVETDYTSNPETMRFEEGHVTEDLLGDQLLIGQVRPLEIEAPYTTSNLVAARIAARAKQGVGRQLRQYRWKMNRQGYQLYPGAVCKITSSRLGLVDLAVRVGDVDQGTLQQPVIDVIAVEDVWAEDAVPTLPPAGGNPDGVRGQAPSMVIACGIGGAGVSRIALFASDALFDIEVWEADDDTGTGATLVATVAGSTLFYDGTVGKYHRARHVQPDDLADPGPFTPWITCAAVDEDPVDPSCVEPTYSAVFDDVLGSVTLTLTDPQGRVRSVEFRHQSGGVWSEWTAATGGGAPAGAIPFAPAPSGLLRIVPVANQSEFAAALADLRDGDHVQMADAAYDEFEIPAGFSGPILFEGESRAGVVVNRGGNSGGFAYRCFSPNVHLRSMTLRNALFGAWLQNASDFVLHDVLIEDVGQEGVVVRNAHRGYIQSSTIQETGQVPIGSHVLGEGIYLGDSTGDPALAADDTKILDVSFVNCTGEHIDIKKPCRRTIIQNTAHDATGIQPQGNDVHGLIAIQGGIDTQIDGAVMTNLNHAELSGVAGLTDQNTKVKNCSVSGTLMEWGYYFPTTGAFASVLPTVFESAVGTSTIAKTPDGDDVPVGEGNVYTDTVELHPTLPSRIEWQILYQTCAGDEAYLEGAHDFPAGPPPVEPPPDPIGLVEVPIELVLLGATVGRGFTGIAAEATAFDSKGISKTKFPLGVFASARIVSSAEESELPEGARAYSAYESPEAPGTWLPLDGVVGPFLDMDAAAVATAPNLPREGEWVTIALEARRDVRLGGFWVGGDGNPLTGIKAPRITLQLVAQDVGTVPPPETPGDPPTQNPDGDPLPGCSLTDLMPAFEKLWVWHISDCGEFITGAGGPDRIDFLNDLTGQGRILGVGGGGISGSWPTWGETQGGTPVLLNGRKVAVFNAAFLLWAENLFSVLTDAALLVVVRAVSDPGPATNYVFSWWLGGDPVDRPIYSGHVFQGGSGHIHEDFASNNRRDLGDPPEDLSQWHVYVVRGAAALYKMWLDGNLRVNSGSNTVGWRQWPQFGNRSYNSNLYVTEIAVWNGATDAELMDAIATVGDRWNISVVGGGDVGGSPPVGGGGGTGAGDDGNEPVPDPPVGGWEPPPSGGSRPMELHAIPVGGLAYWNSTNLTVTVNNYANVIAASLAAGAHNLFKLGPEQHWFDGAGRFSVALFKAKIDALYNNVACRDALIAAAAHPARPFWGWWFFDEIFHPDRYGRLISFAEGEEMAVYLKTRFPTIATILRVDPTDSRLVRKMVGVDYLWAEYHLQRGPVLAYRNTRIQATQELSAQPGNPVGLWFGLHYYDFGGPKSNTIITPRQLREYGDPLVSQSFTAGFGGWKYLAALVEQAGFLTEHRALRDLHASFDP